MRLMLFSLVILATFMSQAEPLPLKGSYQARGRVLPLARRTTDIVDLRLSGAQERVEALKQAGALCELRQPLVRCLTHLPAAQVPRTSLMKILDQNKSLVFEFGEMTGSPRVVAKGDVLLEWEIPQKGLWNGGPFLSYRLFEMADRGPMKIRLPGPQEPLWLNIESAGVLRRYDSLIVRDSRARWHEDSAEVVFERAPSFIP